MNFHVDNLVRSNICHRFLRFDLKENVKQYLQSTFSIGLRGRGGVASEPLYHLCSPQPGARSSHLNKENTANFSPSFAFHPVVVFRAKSLILQSAVFSERKIYIYPDININ